MPLLSLSDLLSYCLQAARRVGHALTVAILLMLPDAWATNPASVMSEAQSVSIGPWFSDTEATVRPHLILRGI